MNFSDGLTWCSPSGEQFHIVFRADFRGKWWFVLDADREMVSGGLATKAEALAEAKRLAEVSA